MPESCVAGIDCGTNTIKLLVLQDGQPVIRETRTVRLGQGVDATRRLAPEALLRTFAAIDEYAALIARYPVGRIRFCATSATRDSSNAEEFSEGVLARLGVRPEVLSGDEEAALSFAGALSGLPPGGRRLVTDIGGGSTELVLGVTAPEQAASLDIGSVRLSERHLHSDPPSDAEIQACRADVAALLDGCPVPLGDADELVGVSGTALTIATGALGLAAYRPGEIHGASVPAEAVLAEVDRIVAMTVDERLATGYVTRGRADVLGGGAIILGEVLRRTGLPALSVADTDILEGIAHSIA